ncbi:MAG: hypothetical protein JSR33_00845 [Proteobacteria bacterium]|nr:hypothetical protein [Pseudomonadota bacterium]
MSKLIEQFLETHRQCTAQNSVFNISQALDREARTMVEQAQAETLRRSKGKTADGNHQQKVFSAVLATHLTRLLDKVDLLDITRYSTLGNAVRRWCPWQPDQQQGFPAVQKTLLTLLPVVRQKQELQQLCRDYRNHLAEEVENEAKNESEQSYTAHTQGRTLLFGAPPLKDRAQVKMVTDSRPPVEKLVTEPTRVIRKSDQAPSLAVQKYQAVSALQATLTTPVKSAPEQMKDFRAQFKIHRPVIEKDRDSWAMKFAKGVATVLSLGVAWLCGIWDVKGQVATDKLQTTLDKPLPPVVTCRMG